MLIWCKYDVITWGSFTTFFYSLQMYLKICFCELEWFSLSSTVNQKVIWQNGVWKLKIRETLNVQVWTLWPIQHCMSGLCNNVAQALPAFSHMCRRPIVVRSGCERQIVGLWKLQWLLNAGCLNLTSKSCGLRSFFEKCLSNEHFWHLKTWNRLLIASFSQELVLFLNALGWSQEIWKACDLAGGIQTRCRCF